MKPLVLEIISSNIASMRNIHNTKSIMLFTIHVDRYSLRMCPSSYTYLRMFVLYIRNFTEAPNSLPIMYIAFQCAKLLATSLTLRFDILL